MNIKMILVNYWLLPIFIYMKCIWSYTIDLSKIDHTSSDIWTFLCDFPVLSTGSDELLIPGYYFSLEKGARLFGYVKIASVEDLDENLVVPDVPTSTESESQKKSKENEPQKNNIKSEFQSLKNKRRYPVFSVRLRKPRRSRFRNHQSYIHLYRSLFDRDDGKPPKMPSVGSSEDTNLDNIFLVLISQNQWQLYLSTGPYDTVQPSRNKRGFVYYSNVVSKFRVPITRVGDVISFEYVSDQTDRYVLMLFNPDQRKMKLEGYVKYENKVAPNLPIEMRYHSSVIRFWWIVYLAAFFVSVTYTFFFVSPGAKKIPYLLSLNYLLYTTFLLMDLVMLQFVTVEGVVPGFIWGLSHMLKRLHEIYILTIMVLLSLGWKILRERLSTVEKQLITSVCGVCILMGFVEVVVSGFDISRYLVHAIACICILVAANFNIVIINTRIADESLTPQAGVAYNHMKIFTNFRLVFFVYMFKPAVFSLIRFVCLQPSFDQVIIWDQHLNLFIDLSFDFLIYSYLFFNFLPRSKKGLFNHIFQNQVITNET